MTRTEREQLLSTLEQLRGSTERRTLPALKLLQALNPSAELAALINTLEPGRPAEKPNRFLEAIRQLLQRHRRRLLPLLSRTFRLLIGSFLKPVRR